MDPINFAATLEASIRQDFEQIIPRAPEELSPLLNLLTNIQTQFELILDRAQGTRTDIPKYPAVDAMSLLGSDEVWRKTTSDFANATNKSTTDLVILWTMLELTEKSGQFYQQAVMNSAHPATRLFLSSLVEVKAILRRRIDAVLRVMYNEIWTSLGFAPFILGKD
jgi:hypothetical protein